MGKEKAAETNSRSIVCKFELQALDGEKNTFSGQASVFGSLIEPQPPSMLPTMLMPGAFKKTINENPKIKILRQHDELIGGGQAYEGKSALMLAGKISETQTGKDALTLMRDGFLDGLSIGFIPIVNQSQIVKGAELLDRLGKMNLDREVASLITDNVESFGLDESYRILNEVKLLEVSLVNFPADPLAHTTEVHEKDILPTETFHIVKRGNKWCLLAKSTGKTLGCHPTRQGAIDQEIAIKKSQEKRMVDIVSKEKHGLSCDDIFAQIKPHAQAILDICTEEEGEPEPAPSEGNPASATPAAPAAVDEDLYEDWQEMEQIRALCSAIIALANMPMMAEEMARKAAAIEQHAGRTLSAATTKYLEEHARAIEAHGKQLLEHSDKMMKFSAMYSAKPQDEEQPDANPAYKGADQGPAYPEAKASSPAPESEPQSNVALDFERSKQKIRRARLALINLKIQGVNNNGQIKRTGTKAE